MKQRSLFTTALLAALCFAALCAPASFAQSQTEPVYQVTHIRVKPEAMREFEAVFKNEVLPAFKKSGGKELQAWTTASLGEAYQYWFVRPLSGLAEFDETHFLIKALGEKGAEDLRQRLRRMSVSQDNFLLTRKPEISWMPDANYQPKVGVLARVTVAHGRAAEYEKFIKENSLPAIPKANSKGYRVSRVGLGGNPREYYSLTLFDSFAEMEKYPALRDKAAAELKLATIPAGLLADTNWTVIRRLPELSLTPAPQQAAK
jgi:hypothetical protein